MDSNTYDLSNTPPSTGEFVVLKRVDGKVKAFNMMRDETGQAYRYYDNLGWIRSMIPTKGIIGFFYEMTVH